LVVSLNWFTRAQAEFSSGDRNDAAPSHIEHPDLVSVWRQPELRFQRPSRNRTHDLAVMSGQPERIFTPVRYEIWHQVK
jgi:hypothetical protein